MCYSNHSTDNDHLMIKNIYKVSKTCFSYAACKISVRTRNYSVIIRLHIKNLILDDIKKKLDFKYKYIILIYSNIDSPPHRCAISYFVSSWKNKKEVFCST